MQKVRIVWVKEEGYNPHEVDLHGAVILVLCLCCFTLQSLIIGATQICTATS